MRRSVPTSAPLLPVAFCLMAGIVVGDACFFSFSWLWLAGVVAVAAMLWRWPLAQSSAIGVAVVLTGMLLVQREKQSLTYDFSDETAIFRAIVVSPPVEKAKTMAVDVMTEKGHRKLRCYLHKDEKSQRLTVGDGLRLQAVIRPVSDFRRGTFSYRRYIQVQGISGECYVRGNQWQREAVGLGGLSRLERSQLWFLGQRERLLNRYRALVAQDDSYAVVAAMTLGDRRALSAELKDTYAIAGASHVLALSGLHLGIIYALLSFLVHGRRWRIVGQTVLVAAIWAFALLVGLPASVVRAATMLSVCAVLSVGGRRAFSMGVLAFAAIVMLAVSPLSLFDVGFQLSFAAMFSILTILPLLQRVVSSEWLQRHRLTGWAWGLMAVSLAAQVGTAPLVAYYFGRLPLYFLLTNFLVVPAAYAILLGSLLMLVLPVAAPVVLSVVETLNRSLDWLSGLPLSSIEVSHPTVLQVVCVYVAIGAVWLAFSKIGARPR